MLNFTQKQKNKALWTAISELDYGDGDVSKLERLLKKGADPDHGGPNLRAIHFAAQVDYSSKAYQAVKILVDHGADLHATSNRYDGGTILHMAAARNNKDLVKYLIEAGMDTEALDDGKNTPLHLALKCSRRWDTAMFLIPDGGGVTMRPNRQGWTPLMLAVGHGAPEEIIDTLFESETDFNRENTSGETLLYTAADKGNLKVVTDILKQDGIDLNKANKTGYTAISRAAASGCEAVLEALLAKGVDADQADAKQVTPLMQAAEEGHTRCVDLLIKAGVELDAKDAEGRTALMAAAAEGHVTIVEALVKAGASMDMTNYDGASAYDIAIRKKQSQVQDFLSRVRQGVVQVEPVRKEMEEGFTKLGDQTLEVRAGGGLKMVFNFWTQQIFTQNTQTPATPATVQSFYDLPRQEALQEARDALLALGGHPAELGGAQHIAKPAIVSGGKP